MVRIGFYFLQTSDFRIGSDQAKIRSVIRMLTHRNLATAAVSSSVNKVISASSSAGKPSSVDEPALVKLKNERDPEKLFNLFKANATNKLVVENRFVFEDTVSRLAGAGQLDYIENLLEHQKTLPQGRREGFIIRIIMLYGRARMTKHAVNTFCDMHLYGCVRTVKSFNAALKVLTESRDLQAINWFLNDVPARFGIVLDAYSFNIVIKGLCEMGILDKAFLVMAGMGKWGLAPDVFTYTLLIEASYKSNWPEIANGLWSRMVLKGCLPNIATFNVRIQYLVNKGRTWDANKLLDYMRRLKKSPEFPDEITYNLVIKGFCKMGNLKMAMYVYSAFRSEGYKPNQKIYQTLIHYFCEAREIDMAYNMCKQSMENNWYPSVDTINKLIDGLVRDEKLEKIDKARHIYSLALKRKPPFNSAQIEFMKSLV
ncbi:pentatricopeptide repeat-containing protein At1g80150, mitochondrial-like [Salvia miltiorrhiza]|uniref:pentatricopeptide repeat-containing protein At1g80150, mitochondrial-like n=1 Tax=Salvia miltiorrhiza TaxID=226208 RepID=UPI0025AD18A0|nr:pentatricopeptide repeat-containing protein At1g80150, mitochondrial-like [Salvia miltiorrhiza]XP_057780444.1 pentatricopeptide repeat-containing protein At1g80150, mitochondrial-like [Salvia miltiorrhiza]XP_057780445.1 pentatricopeptide repeat-containing protein At1g80150, mitochondrial-like [Salvia miltiorrhiza]